MAWIKRKISAYKLEEIPLDNEGIVSSIDISNIAVFIPGYTHPIEVGSWCFCKRKREKVSLCKKGISQFKTLETSFRESRKNTIKLYLEFLLFHLKTGKSIHSLKTAVGQFQQLVNWCDKNYIEGFDSKEKFVKAVNLYTENLIDEIRRNRRNINTAAALQLIVLTAGKGMYDDPYGDLFRHIKKIKKSAASTKITEKPGDELAKKTLKVYQSVFDQLRKFVLDFEPFPKKIEFDHGYFWFFPTSLPFAGPTNINKKIVLTRGSKFIVYDYINGKIKDFSEAIKTSKTRYPERISYSIQHARKQIETANLYPCHKNRIEAATFSFQAFIMMFSANTGMSLSQIASLPSINDFNVEKNKQGFKNIKYRAGEKEVEFFVTSTFVTELEKFLKLRTYILECLGFNDYELLFFRIYKNEPLPLGQSLSTYFHGRLNICFDFNIKITTRMWRAYKSDWLIRNSNVKTAATLLQNTPETILKHYSEGSQSDATGEISGFLSNYSDSLVLKTEENAIPTASGQCISQKPTPLNSQVVIHPNCLQPEGCLFCENYKIHADETDLKKLLSFRYVLEITKPLTHSDPHFKALLAPVIERIDQITSQLVKTAGFATERVEQIKYEINEQETLTPYWSKKLEILDDLGVI